MDSRTMALLELVQTTTADGLRLDGSLQLPSPPTSARAASMQAAALDAVICLHGAGSHFYGSTVFPGIVPTLIDLGIAVLRVNTRGHDLVSTTAGRLGPLRIGGALEMVDDCRYDVAAWVDFLVERGMRRIALVGHSLGAVKAIYAIVNSAAETSAGSFDAVKAIIAISPPRLSYRYFRECARSEDFLASMAQAEQLVAAGQPSTLMSVTFPLPYLIAAAGYIDKYGPEERYHILPLVPRIGRPALFVFGELELGRNVAFAGLADDVRDAPASGHAREVVVIPGANHFYAGATDPLAAEIRRWLGAVSA